MTDRPSDFAKQAIAAMERDTDKVRALAAVIRRAMVEAALQGVDAGDEAEAIPPLGGDIVKVEQRVWPTIAPGCVVAPRDVARVAGITKSTAYQRLRNAVKLGWAVRESPGFYRIVATGAGLRALTRPDYVRVSDVR